MHELFKNIVNNIQHFLKNTSGTNKFSILSQLSKTSLKNPKKEEA